jgi:hypoxanthine-DNA glycosylase
MAAVLDWPVPQTIEEKKAMLHRNGIALWDSIAQCRIEGSSDASIEQVIPNDLSPIFEAAEIRRVYCNGKKSLEVYNRYIEPVLGRPAEALPSTSPANAAWNLERLTEAWAVVKDNLL